MAIPRAYSFLETVFTLALVLVLSALAIPAYERLRVPGYDACAPSDLINLRTALAGEIPPRTGSYVVVGPALVSWLRTTWVSRGVTLRFHVRAAQVEHAGAYTVRARHRDGSKTYRLDQTGSIRS